MKRFTKFKILIVLIYVSILILISLMENIIILAITGSLIIIVDKFLIPELENFEIRVNLRGYFNELYQLLNTKGLTPNLGKSLAFIIDEIGEKNMLKILDLSNNTAKEEEDYGDNPHLDYVGKDFELSIWYEFGDNKVRIYQNVSFYDYSNTTSNRKIYEDFLNYFKTRCSEAGIKIKGKR